MATPRRRWRTWLANGAAALSAVLAVALAVAWWRVADSPGSEMWGWRNERGGPPLVTDRAFALVNVASRRTVISVGDMFIDLGKEFPTNDWATEPNPTPAARGWFRQTQFFVFNSAGPWAGASFPRDAAHHGWSVWLRTPTWLAFTVLVTTPVVRVAVLVRKRRRPRIGHCAACGYDLRATPDRCPECGNAAVSQATPAA